MAAVRGRAAGPLIKPPRLGGTGPPRAPEPRGLGRAAPRRGMYALKIRGEREGRGEGEGKKGRGGRPPAPPTSPHPPPRPARDAHERGRAGPGRARRAGRVTTSPRHRTAPPGRADRLVKPVQSHYSN